MKKIFLMLIMGLFLTEGKTMQNETEEIKEIIKLPHSCLTTKASELPDTPDGLEEGRKITISLASSLLPLMPAAGLAAPQIGISKRVFIFSWNREVQNLAAAINPTFVPIDDEMSSGWEGCFSVPLALAKVSRHQNIRVSYTTTMGVKEHYVLRGFAARVFQHEFDHLEGIENIHKPQAEIKTFPAQEEMTAFITEIKKGDQSHYIQPEKVDIF